MTTPRVRRVRSGSSQGGYLLLTTLAIILFFSVTLIAVLSMTMTAAVTTAKRVERSESLRLGDSALEEVVNDRRLDRINASTPTVAGNPCPGTGTVGTVSNAYDKELRRASGAVEHVAVSCTPGPSSTTGREFVLRSYVQGELKGMAAVRLDDQISPGQGLLICDWQLGSNAGAVPATCP